MSSPQYNGSPRVDDLVDQIDHYTAVELSRHHNTEYDTEYGTEYNNNQTRGGEETGFGRRDSAGTLFVDTYENGEMKFSYRNRVRKDEEEEEQTPQVQPYQRPLPPLPTSAPHYAHSGDMIVAGIDTDTGIEYDYNGRVMHIHRDPRSHHHHHHAAGQRRVSADSEAYSEYFALDATEYHRDAQYPSSNHGHNTPTSRPGRPIHTFNIEDPRGAAATTPKDAKKRERLTKFVRRIVEKLEACGWMQRFCSCDCGSGRRRSSERPKLTLSNPTLRSVDPFAMAVPAATKVKGGKRDGHGHGHRHERALPPLPVADPQIHDIEQEQLRQRQRNSASSPYNVSDLPAMSSLSLVPPPLTSKTTANPALDADIPPVPKLPAKDFPLATAAREVEKTVSLVHRRSEDTPPPVPPKDDVRMGAGRRSHSIPRKPVPSHPTPHPRTSTTPSRARHAPPTGLFTPSPSPLSHSVSTSISEPFTPCPLSPTTTASSTSSKKDKKGKQPTAWVRRHDKDKKNKEDDDDQDVETPRSAGLGPVGLPRAPPVFYGGGGVGTPTPSRSPTSTRDGSGARDESRDPSRGRQRHRGGDRHGRRR